jgi:hypothetical protein
MFSRFCGSEIKNFRFLNGIMVFTCDTCEREYVTGFGWRKNEMCKLDDKIVKEAEEYHLCERLEELHHEYYNWNGSKVPVSLVDLLNGACAA